jgi:signal transduction histidine kinase/CheY-like chemotaxis protein
MSVGVDERCNARAQMHVRLLLELTSRLSEPLSSEEVAQVVIDRAAAAVEASSALMWIAEEPPTHARLIRATGCAPDVEARCGRIPLEPWLPMGDAIRRREALFFESRADYRDRYPIAQSRGYDVEASRELSFACLPLVVHGGGIGGVAIVFPDVRGLDDDERHFLVILAHHAAQAVERASLFERQRGVRDRLSRLQQLTAALSSAATVEEIAHLVARVGADALRVSAAVVWASDERGDLRLLASYGAPELVVASLRHVAADSDVPVARAARERRPYYHEGDGVLPLVRDERTLGVLGFSAGRLRCFSPEERGFAATIAEHCADALARARLYEEARQVERRAQSVLDRLPVGVILARPPNADLVLTNEAMARVWRADHCGDGAPRMRRASFPDGRPVAHEDWPLMRALRGEVVESQELRIVRDDGTEGWVDVRAAPIRRDDGTIEAAVAATLDVTAEKTARAAADAASRAKDEFLAMLGHELRNPLAPIVTALHLMRLQGDGSFERERAVIERQVSHLVRLVDDLLDVSRVTRGELRLVRAPVEVAAVVAAAIEVAGPLVEERRHRLAVSVPEEGLLLDVDAERIEQVITNLLTNAAKYTPAGGSIAVCARAEPEHVAIEVTDDGIGIAPELLPVVFEAFTQGRQGLDRKDGGLGLGLAIARQLIVAHGGTIEAKSAGRGRGTTMIVRLPHGGAPSHGGGRAEAAALPESRPVRRRVLVVDDNPDAATLLFELLTQVGHEVETANDAPNALQIVQRFAPDIAFLDIGLPVMDGYELARQLRRLSSCAATPLVAVTGYAQEDDRRCALESGFTEHLSKPLDPRRVLECIERLCPAAPPR